MNPILLALTVLAPAHSGAVAQQPPPTPEHAVVDTLWGTP